MWNYLKEFPCELFGQQIFPFLCVKSIAMLETALASHEMQRIFRSFLAFSPTLKVSVNLNKSCDRRKWLKDRHCRIDLASVNFEIAAEISPLDLATIDNIQLKINAKVDIIYKLTDQFCDKVTSVFIDGLENAIFIRELFSCIVNVRHLEACDMTDENIVNIIIGLNGNTSERLGNVGLESIKISNVGLENGFTDRSVGIIAITCPRLLTLDINCENLTSASLQFLSQKGLPIREFNLEKFIEIPSARIATHCAHALSRIRSFKTLPYTEWANDTNTLEIMEPYLTGIHELHALSDWDHCLLPKLCRHHLSLESLTLDFFSSATAEQVVELIQSSSTGLHTLELDGTSSIVNDALIVALAPICPDLQKIEFNYSCHNITDISLLALSQHCQKLQYVDIYRCTNLTENAILQFIKCFSKLRELFVSDKCLSEDTALILPVKRIEKSYDGITLYF